MCRVVVLDGLLSICFGVEVAWLRRLAEGAGRGEMGRLCDIALEVIDNFVLEVTDDSDPEVTLETKSSVKYHS
jgi:hypothetical protein